MGPMLFLVISEPAATRPTDAVAGRLQYRQWLDALTSEGVVRSYFPRVGRGMVVVLDVPSHEALSTLLTEWCEMVPVQFRIEPLREPHAMREALLPACNA